MEPRVPGLEYENDGTAGTSPEEEPERDQAAIAADRRMKKELLVETFGSKKARVQQNARLREKVMYFSKLELGYAGGKNRPDLFYMPRYLWHFAVFSTLTQVGRY